MIESQASVNPKFLENIMAPQRSKVKQEDQEEDTEEIVESKLKFKLVIAFAYVLGTLGCSSHLP